MRVNRVKVGIKDLKQFLNDIKETMEKLERGEKVKKMGVYLTSLEALRKVLTPKRFKLLHTIKTKKPNSIKHLARITKRTVKSTKDDINNYNGPQFLDRAT